MPLKKLFTVTRRGTLALTTGILVVAACNKTLAQGAVILSDHKLTYEEKRRMLEGLWERPLGWYPAKQSQCCDLISMRLSDSAIAKGKARLDTLSYCYAQLYNAYALQSPDHTPDSVLVIFTNGTDSLTPVYGSRFSVKQLRKKRLSGYDLCLSLAFFSNNPAVAFPQPGELVIYFTKPTPFDLKMETWYHVWISSMAAIMGKYFLAHDRKYKRLMILWEDPLGVLLHNFSEPRSDAFKAFSKWF